MTTRLEERLSRELSAGPSNLITGDSAAFADDVIGRVNRRARRHRAVFTGTIAAFVAAFVALAWTARTSLRVSTDGGDDSGQLAGPAADAEAPGSEAATSAVEAAIQSTPGVSTTTTLIAFAILLGLPMLAGFTSWHRPKNRALPELGRVGRAVLMMLLAFYSVVSFTGLLLVGSFGTLVTYDRAGRPSLIDELHARSWIALAVLAVAAVVPWLVRFDFATVRAAARMWGAIRASLALWIFYAILNRLDTQFDFLLHVAAAVATLWFGFVHLPRLRPLKRSRKLAFVAIAATLTAVSFVSFTWQVLFIPSSSMAPTLEQGTRAIVNRLDTDIDRGDIIVYRSPQRPAGLDRIRRVIGVGGDVVAGRDGQLFVNGVVPDYFIGPEDGGTTLYDFDEVRVPIDELFLMGDNYSGSSDSRHEGTVSRSLVKATESEFNSGAG